MKSTIKKLENNIIKALTIACENAKTTTPGFSWLTHSAKFDNFPASLVVTCVFETEQQIVDARQQKLDQALIKDIHKQMLKIGVVLKQPRHNVFFDSEERCIAEHAGNWKKRLQPH
ncbi:Fis family transcriptional regulator [Neptunicella marina]|uniref:Fis family transcriptional regulator n=1 Tax=Neptunicella marina TaxID=2125989 RepID=A0A8J6IUP1_9ALTE|nr:Fis family transcriptional regulator [Neptunicella marina]MBC3766170.1 Fis family transcriptional regulator [Neptunicella marina]